MIFNPVVKARLANPRMVNGRFYIDGEFMCDQDVDRKIAAMNLRLFFDATQFKTTADSMRFVDFLPDWKIQGGKTLFAQPGNLASKAIFNTVGPVAYINCPIEGPYFLEHASQIPTINNWTRYFTLVLTPINYVPGKFSPVVILDKEHVDPNQRGGFLPNDGLTLSLCVSNVNTQETGKFAYCIEQVTEHLNWKPNGGITMPFGSPDYKVFL
jgi:hypothetical protein